MVGLGLISNMRISGIESGGAYFVNARASVKPAIPPPRMMMFSGGGVLEVDEDSMTDYSRRNFEDWVSEGRFCSCRGTRTSGWSPNPRDLACARSLQVTQGSPGLRWDEGTWHQHCVGGVQLSNPNLCRLCVAFN